MPYATQAQLELAAGGADRLTSLTDWNQDGTGDATVIAEALEVADGLIDGYLRARGYNLPLANPTDSLRRVAAQEAVFWLRDSRGMASEDHVRQHEERLAWLRDVAKGAVRVDEPSAPEAMTTRSAWVSPASDKAVTRDNLKGFV